MRACKIFFFMLTGCALSFVGAQSSSGSVSVSPLTMPSVSAPTMPKVTAPSIGNDYYVPGSSSFYHGSYPGIRNGLANRMRQTVTADTQTGAQSLNQTNAAHSTNSTGTGTALLSNNAFAGLTASDLSSMDSMGLLGKYSGLLSNGKGLATANALAAAKSDTSADSILLQQILGQLTEIKNQNVNASLNAASGTTTALGQAEKAGSKILRFTVNGYDVLSTCRDVYFSTQESDGSFLLTGDRKYQTDGESRCETFYLLFHTKGAREGITQYSVTPEVTQDTTNTYSLMYQLAQKKGLTAQRTGNFISMRLKEADWNMDMLLSMQ
ncbi:MAG: hypothetical protein IJS09_05955 [Treponema sp.]|nr:hypothetical protein [Treponema sp.]